MRRPNLLDTKINNGTFSKNHTIIITIIAALKEMAVKFVKAKFVDYGQD